MENNKSAELQAKRYKRYMLIKAIRAKKEELECFDIEQNFDEDMFTRYMGDGRISFMWREYESIETMRKVDSSAFEEMYSDYIDSLDKRDFVEYTEMEEELEDLKNELLEIEDEIKQIENHQLAALQAKRDELINGIKAKQKEMDCFDVSEYYSERSFIEKMQEEYGTVNIMGYQYNAIDALYELDNTAFREMYNNHIDTLDKNDFEGYRELEEELEELENELLEIDDEIEQLENG